MRMRIKPWRSLALASWAVLSLGAVGIRAADRPGILGRLFSGGGSNHAPAAKPAPERTPAPARPPGQPAAPVYSGAPASSAFQPVPPAAALPTINDIPTGPEAAPRIRPQARVNRAATEADPILTRIALGRSDNGEPFGMFLQVYADGTVIDGEGVHRAGADVMRPLLQALQAPELSRVQGHCGAPPTDFIEQVYVTVFERTKLGGLRANSFSYTGNPQGCDPAVRNLQTAIEALASRLSSPAPAHAPASTAASATPPLSAPTAPALGLTPES